MDLINGDNDDNKNNQNRKVTYKDAQSLLSKLNDKWTTFPIELSAKDDNIGNINLIEKTFDDIALFLTQIKLKLSIEMLCFYWYFFDVIHLISFVASNM